MLNQLYRFVPDEASNGKTSTSEATNETVTEFVLTSLQMMIRTCSPPNTATKGRVQDDLLAHPAFHSLFSNPVIVNSIF